MNLDSGYLGFKAAHNGGSVNDIAMELKRITRIFMAFSYLFPYFLDDRGR